MKIGNVGFVRTKQTQAWHRRSRQACLLLRMVQCDWLNQGPSLTYFDSDRSSDIESSLSHDVRSKGTYFPFPFPSVLIIRVQAIENTVRVNPILKMGQRDQKVKVRATFLCSFTVLY